MDQAEQLRNIVKLHNQRNLSGARVITITNRISEERGITDANLKDFVKSNVEYFLTRILALQMSR